MKLVALARKLVVPAAFLALGLRLAPVLAGTPATPRPVAAPVAEPAPSAVVRSNLDAEALRRAVRAAVRDELTAQRTTAAPTAAAPADEPAALDEPTAPQREAAARATAAVERILARGEVGGEDTMALRGELAAMPAAEADALRSQVVQAINRGRLRPTGAL